MVSHLGRIVMFCLLVVVLQLVQIRAACPKMDLRVAKAMNDRGYDKVRVSVITTPDTEADCDFGDFFDYSEQFFGVPGNNMMTFNLRTAIKQVEPGSTCSLEVGGEKLLMQTPEKGSRVRGLLFSDPCTRQQLPGPPCPNGVTFAIQERFSKAINELVGSDEIHFWGILGDNFYDATGKILVEFWEMLSLEAKSKPFVTVPGNHDFWNAGAPQLGQLGGVDNFGYGWLQYSGQDVVASLVNSTPYDFSVKPGISHPFHDGAPLDGIPKLENFVFWHQIGSVAMFGWSGAHAVSLNPMTSHALLDPYLEKFCKWVGESDDIHAFLLFGHWNGPNLGCQPGMDTPRVYKTAMSKSGCAKKKGLYFDGHDHCNRAMPNEVVDSADPLPVGFMIGASGMNGDCAPTSGFVVVDSIPDAKGGPDVRVDYYVADDAGQWDALVKCWENNKGQGQSKCRDDAVKWRDVPEPSAEISARQLSIADVPPCKQPPRPSPSPSPGPSPGPSKPGGPNVVVIIIVVAAVVLIVGVAAGLLYRRRAAGARIISPQAFRTRSAEGDQADQRVSLQDQAGQSGR